MSLKGLQILVVEDAPDVLDVLTMLLRSEGADDAAVGTHEALKVFRVVSDLGLPDISGDVLIRPVIAGRSTAYQGCRHHW